MGYDARIDRLPIACVIDLKGAPALVADVMLVPLKLRLPQKPNTSSGTAATTVMWIGPDHWIIRAPLAQEDALMAGLAGASDALGAVLVSDAYASFEISGPDAADIVMQASPLDIGPTAFPENGASFTEFFGQKALLLRTKAGFECLVDASYGDYIADFLSRCNAGTA